MGPCVSCAFHIISLILSFICSFMYLFIYKTSNSWVPALCQPQNIMLGKQSQQWTKQSQCVLRKPRHYWERWALNNYKHKECYKRVLWETTARNLTKMRVRKELLKEIMLKLKLMHEDTVASQKVEKNIPDRGNCILKDLEVWRSTFEEIKQT